ILSLGLAGFVGCSSEPASEPESTGSISQAATILDSGFTDTTVVTGLSNPTAMAFAPDGRLFVAQQAGQLRVVKNGALLATPFLTLSVDSNGERGLLGVTFDPSFAANKLVYVYYTTTSGGTHNRISRFTANGDVATVGSETVLVDLPALSAATNHNGGALHFGNDGKLYVAVGENATGSNAQNMTTPFGKLLRFNSDGTIPSDNPFFASTTGVNRAIWALGLRNPFTFDVRRSTGAILINDVGNNAWEEVNSGGAGRNYGWPTSEGATTNPAFTGPLYVYPHASDNSGGCAITGGAFYDPTTVQFPASYVGKYFFADYCNGWIRKLDPATGTATLFATGLNAVVDIRVGPEGALYYLARGANAIGKITFPTSQPPSIASQPSSVTVPVGGNATFTVSASGSAPLSYQWQRNGSNISGATSASYSLTGVQVADSGAQFRAVVTNTFGTATSNAAVLTVTNNTAPTVSITSPTAGATYTGGSTLTFAGTATDAEDGTLPASAFTWRIDLHHDQHVHPALQDTSGAKSGSWAIPSTGHTETTVFYRVTLTVKDSSGLTSSTFVDVVPVVRQITLNTVPAGLTVTLDGQPFTAPLTADSVVGVQRDIGVSSPQSLSGKTYGFSAWSDAGAATHTITTPASNTTYTATFKEASGFTAEYYDNQNLTGLFATRSDASIDFDWSTGAPISGMGADTFSVRWTGSTVPQFSETYTFHTVSDDGVRLWVNGTLVIDNWTDHGPAENAATMALVAGQSYSIKMEYYENAGGAVARLHWSSPSTPRRPVPFGSNGLPASFTGSYYDNADLTTLKTTRADASIDFDWGTGAPATGVGADTFSVRWTGNAKPTSSETYTFYTQSDDGVRLWVNGSLLIDNWTNHSSTQNSANLALVAGQTYAIKLEYYENTGGAVAKLHWSSPTLSKRAIPPAP
ncbi:MAG: PA14 domain-containing protein, partial [Myxococcales bacterium]